MWDPISLFFCMWGLNIGMPEARLRVTDIIIAKEEALINKIIVDSVQAREKFNYGYKNN